LALANTGKGQGRKCLEFSKPEQCIVRAPNKAEKNFTQNMELSKDWITHEIRGVKGGADK
jgi:hypothetical protein